MRSRVHAAVVTSFLGMLTWVLPPVSYLSGAALGLYTLRRGLAEGVQVLLGAAVLALLLALVGIGNALPALALVLALWVPVAVAALVLRTSMAQGPMLLAVVLLGVLVLTGLHLVVGDLPAWWARWLGELESSLPSGTSLGLDEAARARIAAVMTGIVAAAMVTSLTATVLLARWWQSLLYNPGGFRDEFHGLRLPRPMLYATGMIGAVAIAQSLGDALRGGIATELLLVATVAYMFQGLAVVHQRARARGVAGGWLVPLYLGLALLPQYLILVLGLLGAADGIVNFRRLGTAPPA